jgi:hypothetical protein
LRAATALLFAVAIAAMLVLSQTAVATGINVSGTWQTTYHCTSTGCAGQDFPDAITLTQAQGSTTVGGTDQVGSTIVGSITGNALTFTLTDGSYTANYTVTVSVNGTQEAWSGTLTDSHGTSGTDTATLGNGPVLAKSGEASTVSGTVLVESPGATTFAPLSSATSIPMGSTIDATNGTVAITVSLPGGGTQKGQFYDGEFRITQARSGVTKEALAGGSFVACATAASATASPLAHAAAAAKKNKTVVRDLWGNAHGKFTTAGRAGEASVLGTVWFTEDRCDGTLFQAKKDQITVTVVAHPKLKHRVAQGHSFFAPLPAG